MVTDLAYWRELTGGPREISSHPFWGGTPSLLSREQLITFDDAVRSLWGEGQARG